MTKPRRKNCKGETRGRLEFLEFFEKDKRQSARWIAVCDCGNLTLAYPSRKDTLSCGCLYKELQTKRTERKKTSAWWLYKREFNAWNSMKQRCLNKKSQRYYAYGARGIIICAKWIESFEMFLNDMKPCPQGFTLERINNNGNYELKNCRWASRTEQANNKSTNKYYVFGNERLSISQWARKFQVNTQTFSSWIKRHSFNEAIKRAKIYEEKKAMPSESAPEKGQQDMGQAGQGSEGGSQVGQEANQKT